MRALVLATCVLVLSPACKKRVPIDQSTPEHSLASFFTGLGAGRLPDDLDNYLSSDSERSAWRLRCKTRGCKQGRFTVVERGDMGDYQATLFVDYEIFGSSGDRIMKGEHSPIRFEREGDRWMIDQFGRRQGATSAATGYGGPAATGDGGPAATGDGGPAATEDAAQPAPPPAP
jgi:hypothetical protein